MRRTVGLLLFCAAVAIVSPAQTFTKLYDFQGLTDSGYPWASLVQGVDGSYYGEAQGIFQNNDPGAIFKITSSGTFTTVHHFDSNNPLEPAGPIGGLVRVRTGDLYGAGGGGLYGSGTVFEVTPEDNVTTVYSFCALGANCPDGTFPWAPPIQGADGNLYGTTGTGGTTDCRYGCGTIFRMTPEGVLTTLHSFQGPDGANPHARLMLANDGNFYGTTFHGGSTQGRCNNNYAPGCGTVFRITPNGVFTTLHVFCLESGCPDGSNPAHGLIQGEDGYLYGVTSSVISAGTVFRMSTDGTLTTITTFAQGEGADGELLQAPDGDFYGTLFTAGVGDRAFKLTPSGVLTTLYKFCMQNLCKDGEGPEGALTLGSDGLLYATSYQFGVYGFGTVFNLDVGFVPLSITKTGNGTVISGDNRIYCGQTCSNIYVHDTQVGLTAIPAPGSTFTGWTGCDNTQNSFCLVKMSSARNVTASFDTATVMLTSLLLNPTSVKGGQLSVATLSLSAPAPPGGVGVSITSDNPQVAHPPSWVVIPGGKTSVSFAVRTSVVRAKTLVNITASASGSQVSATLTVTTGSNQGAVLH